MLDDVFTESGIKVLTQTRVTNIVNDGGLRRVIFLRGGLEKSVRVDEVICWAAFSALWVFFFLESLTISSSCVFLS